MPEALDSVPANVIDSATAMGFTRLRRALTVELPLALPVLVANMRVVAVTNISLVSVGSLIGIGGLGTLFTQGYQRDYPDQILAGIIAIVVLALAFDLLLFLVGRALTPWTRQQKIGARRWSRDSRRPRPQGRLREHLRRRMGVHRRSGKLVRAAPESAPASSSTSGTASWRSHCRRWSRCRSV